MKRFKSIAVVACAILVAAAYVLPAQPASAVSSASLSIVPKKNYTIEPGKSVKDKLTIRNLDDKEPLELNLRVVDFTFTDDGGTPSLMLAEDAPQTPWSLKPFLTLPETVTVAPKQSKTLDMGVSIPTGQGAGSYYSAIVYSSGASDGGNVGLSASGVTLVFTSIPGKATEDLKLQKFGAYKAAVGDSKAKYTFIASDEPQMLAYTLKNDGNVAEAPVGSITLKDMFGKERVISDVNPNGSLALIGQSRTFTACIKLQTEEVKLDGAATSAKTCASPGLWPGLYTATLDVFYGQNGNATQEIVSTGSFWYLPLWFVISFSLLLLILAFMAWRVVHAIRSKLYGHRPRKITRRR